MKQILREMKKKIEKGWCQGTYARNVKGERTGVFDLDACQFCLAGAFLLVRSELNLAYSVADLNNFIKRKRFVDIVTFNDYPNRTKEEVIELLEELINEASN